MEGDYRSMIAMLLLQIAVSIPPIRVFQPYPSLKCPKGYELWWPQYKEFDNDKYAQCVKWEPTASKIVEKAGKNERLPIHGKSRGASPVHRP